MKIQHAVAQGGDGASLPLILATIAPARPHWSPVRRTSGLRLILGILCAKGTLLLKAPEASPGAVSGQGLQQGISDQPPAQQVTPTSRPDNSCREHQRTLLRVRDNSVFLFFLSGSHNWIKENRCRLHSSVISSLCPLVQSTVLRKHCDCCQCQQERLLLISRPLRYDRHSNHCYHKRYAPGSPSSLSLLTMDKTTAAWENLLPGAMTETGCKTTSRRH